MTNTEIAAAARPLTPRQDRIEAEMTGVLRRGGTRSALRALVEEYADYARVQGTSSETALAVVMAIAQRAGPEIAARGESPVGDSASERVAMMVSWFKSRYHRAD